VRLFWRNFYRHKKSRIKRDLYKAILIKLLDCDLYLELQKEMVHLELLQEQQQEQLLS
jgi:hypothetical protein